MNVLICDDEPDIQVLLRFTVEALGHQARAVGSATEALLACADRIPDVLLLDVSMPGTDGPTLLRELRAVGLAPPVTMLVSAVTAQDLESLAEELDVAYLTKPCTYDRLAEAMDGLAA